MDATVLERFKWTLAELDEQDEGRSLKMLSLLNTAGSYQRILEAVRAHNLRGLSAGDYAAYKMLMSNES